MIGRAEVSENPILAISEPALQAVLSPGQQVNVVGPAADGDEFRFIERDPQKRDGRHTRAAPEFP